MDPKQLTLASYIASGIGIGLLALSFVSPYLFTDRGAWSDDNAEEHRIASAELYRLAHVYAHHDGAEDPPELAAARTRFEQSQQHLESSVGGRQTMRSVIKWIGILACIIGIGGAVMLRVNDD